MTWKLLVKNWLLLGTSKGTAARPGELLGKSEQLVHGGECQWIRTSTCLAYIDQESTEYGACILLIFCFLRVCHFLFFSESPLNTSKNYLKAILPPAFIF